MLQASDRPVPDGVATDRVVLRPLRATDVDLDYDAVMSSAAMLRRWSQTSWPADDFTRAENLADLERHEREHLEGVAYTFTVLDPTATRCLGCVYFSPLDPAEAELAEGATSRTRVAFWVRASEVANDLDRHLLDVLRRWLAESWAFDAALFTIAHDDTRQRALFEDAGMTAFGTIVLRGDRSCRVYR